MIINSSPITNEISGLLRILNGMKDDNFGCVQLGNFDLHARNQLSLFLKDEQLDLIPEFDETIGFNGNRNMFKEFFVSMLYSIPKHPDFYLRPNQGEIQNAMSVNKSLKEFSNKIFIVHGHDGQWKAEIARFITVIGLNPVILHEQPNEGKAIIEKFESVANTVGYAIVLLTADDIGFSKKLPKQQQFRARQNVIFELGFFSAKLGRARVAVMYESGTELPSDISGIVYIPFDKNDGWKISLIKELKCASYNVDANQL